MNYSIIYLLRLLLTSVFFACMVASLQNSKISSRLVTLKDHKMYQKMEYCVICYGLILENQMTIVQDGMKGPHDEDNVSIACGRRRRSHRRCGRRSLVCWRGGWRWAGAAHDVVNDPLGFLPG